MDYLDTARRVECTPQNIIIGARRKYLYIAFGASLLLKKSEVALENSGYIKARQIFDSMEWDIISC